MRIIIVLDISGNHSTYDYKNELFLHNYQTKTFFYYEF